MQPTLEKPSVRRREEFLAAVRKSRRLHGKWTAAPKTPKEFSVWDFGSKVFRRDI